MTNRLCLVKAPDTNRSISPPFKPGNRVMSKITRKYPNRTDYMEDAAVYTVLWCTSSNKACYPSGWRVTTNRHRGMDAGMFILLSSNEGKK